MKATKRHDGRGAGNNRGKAVSSHSARCWSVLWPAIDYSLLSGPAHLRAGGSLRVPNSSQGKDAEIEERLCASHA